MEDKRKLGEVGKEKWHRCGIFFFLRARWYLFGLRNIVGSRGKKNFGSIFILFYFNIISWFLLFGAPIGYALNLQIFILRFQLSDKSLEFSLIGLRSNSIEMALLSLCKTIKVSHYLLVLASALARRSSFDEIWKVCVNFWFFPPVFVTKYWFVVVHKHNKSLIFLCTPFSLFCLNTMIDFAWNLPLNFLIIDLLGDIFLNFDIFSWYLYRIHEFQGCFFIIIRQSLDPSINSWACYWLNFKKSSILWKKMGPKFIQAIFCHGLTEFSKKIFFRILFKIS